MQAREIRITGNIIENVINVARLHSEIDNICRASLIRDKVDRLIALTKELTHTAIMLEEEVTGKPAATISVTTKYPTYDLESVMDFGKWKGYTVRDVIHRDPVYIMWTHDHVKKFKLPADVVDALITIL